MKTELDVLLDRWDACAPAREWARGRTVSEDTWNACPDGWWLVTTLCEYGAEWDDAYAAAQDSDGAADAVRTVVPWSRVEPLFARLRVPMPSGLGYALLGEDPPREYPHDGGPPVPSPFTAAQIARMAGRAQ